MKTAVITTGGLGTRLLTVTKGNPKAMLPLYIKSKDRDSTPLLQPLIEIIFNNLYDQGFRKFCFIVGKKTKDSIINHLTPDSQFLELLKTRNNLEDRRFAKILEQSYKKFKNSNVKWITQNTPMGFGHALLSASKFVGRENFLLHAGDAYFPNYDFLKNMIKKYEKSKNISASLCIQQKKDVKGYGIAQIYKKNNEDIVFSVQEKPKKPLSKNVILPIYLFDHNVFNALKNIPHGFNGELQVTDAIMKLLNQDRKITSFDYENNTWFDIGTSNRYYQAISHSYKISKK